MASTVEGSSVLVHSNWPKQAMQQVYGSSMLCVLQLGTPDKILLFSVEIIFVASSVVGLISTHADLLL